MPIITISRGTFSGGKEFAEALAQKLDYRCLSREELSEEAIKYNVPVGKLQTAIVKPPRVYERMGPQREFYLSTITSILCKYALEGNLVYHGHTGHMLLPGIPHIFRIRVLGDMEYRIDKVMSRLKLSREKAVDYIANVDSDRDKWVRFLYGINWHDPSQYDLVVNLDHLGIANATTALCTMAELPDFKMTPASERALRNLYLANLARSLLARDKRTGYAEFKVTANEGVVHVVCLPQQAEVAQYVNDVLRELEGCRDIHCTIAGSTILWLGEEFDVGSELYNNVTKIARKWDAAVEIMRHITTDRDGGQALVEESTLSDVERGYTPQEYNGGIEDDVEDVKATDDAGTVTVSDALLKEGCFGGSSTIYGEKDSLITTLSQRKNYRLLVIGDLFTSKPKSTRTRLTSELTGLLSDNVKSPVVSADELKQSLKFSLKDFLKLGFFLAVAIVMFLAVFLNQETVLKLLAHEQYKAWRILVIVGILVFIPTFAYSYGSSTRKILKLFGLD